jgi:hypothetical protein
MIGLIQSLFCSSPGPSGFAWRSQTAGGAAENNTKAWQGINKNKNKSSQRKLAGKLLTSIYRGFFYILLLATNI